MSKEKQILRLLSEGISQRKTADMLSVSRNRVASVYAAARRSDQSFPELLRLNEPVLYQALYPEKAAEPVQVIPDYELIHKELLRSGVTLRLLWEEYVDTCREAKKPPYMYSQFCKRYTIFSPIIQNQSFDSQTEKSLHLFENAGKKIHQSLNLFLRSGDVVQRSGPPRRF